MKTTFFAITVVLLLLIIITTKEVHCDDDVNGQTFIELAGMTRRNAGILTAIPRQCGSLADFLHTCVAEPSSDIS